MWAIKSVTRLVWLTLILRPNLAMSNTQPYASIEILYVVARNEDTSLYGISQTNISAGTMQSVYILDDPSEEIHVGMPDHERTLFEQIVESGTSSGIQSSEYGTLQSILGAWLLDSNRLLVATSNGLCRGVGLENCYGYYEFFTLSVPNVAEKQTVTKIGYHNPVLDRWDTCISAIWTISIEEVTVNPVFDRLAFTLREPHNCYSDIGSSELIVIDFEQTPSQISRIEMAGGALWSPTGTQLAYSQRDCPQREGHNPCEMSILIAVENSTTIADSFSQLPNAPYVIPNWLDENTLVFPMTILNEDRSTFIVNDLESLQRHEQLLEQPLVMHNNRYYFADGRIVFRLIDNERQREEGFNRRVEYFETALRSTSRIFYSTRRPEQIYLAMDNSGCLSHLLSFDLALDVIDFQFSSFVPSNMCITYLAA